MGFQNWRMAPCPDLKPLPTAETSLDWGAAGFRMVSAGTLSGFMGFRLAPCLVLWDFKTDGWPPVPISNPSPQPRPPWIELRRALAWFRLAPSLWFYGISAGTLSGFMGFQNWRMAPCPDLKPLPTAETSLDWTAAALSAGTLSGFMGFRLAPCLVLWDFKTDGWPPVPISNPSPQPRPPWIELRRALAWFRLAPSLVLWDFGWHLVWFYGISKLTDGPLSRSQTPPHSRDLLGLSCGGL